MLADLYEISYICIRLEADALKDFDLEYICATMGDLSGVPVRIFEGAEQVFYHTVVTLPRDPMQLYRDGIWAVKDHLGYYVTPQFHYYGIVNSGALKIVVGPTFPVPSADQTLRELAFRADVPPDETEAFVQGIKSIIPLPLESLMQMLCTVNHLLNREKLQLEDIAIFSDEQVSLHSASQKRRVRRLTEEIPLPHNTYDLEQTLLYIVRKGDTAALRQWASRAPAVRGGTLAGEALRQMRNTFIVTTTLVSRAAIRGGMDVEEAFSLSDAYIQQCELLNAPDRLTNLQYHMIGEFTERVERIRHASHESRLAALVANYVQKHLSEPISTEALAKELYMGRTHLSARFHRETGETLAAFITKEKMEEAKRLLRWSDKPITAIGNYLGYSSSGHFGSVFKKTVGLTPGEYREKHGK